jgi:hypothetical protein
LGEHWLSVYSFLQGLKITDCLFGA